MKVWLVFFKGFDIESTHHNPSYCGVFSSRELAVAYIKAECDFWDDQEASYSILASTVDGNV